jgi:hypothetical protein
VTTAPAEGSTRPRLGAVLLEGLAWPLWTAGWLLGFLLWPLWLGATWVATAVALGFADARPGRR